MTVQEIWNSGISLLNLCAVYYVIQLARCVLFSFVVSAFVFTVRKTVLKNKVFLKGVLWSLFIPVLFMGRMQFFYENRIGAKLFTSWTGICMNHIWICWLYLGGIFVYATLLFYRRKKLKKMVAGMEKRKVGDTVIYVTKMPVTPSTVGIFRHKIVMPEVILKEYSEKEFQTILLHEKTHIRLGHLLFYLLWDILRVLLWLNPLLTVGTKYFREDMEEICDWVTIQKSKGKAYTYGQLLLRSMRVLQTESEDFNMFATFAGDKEYQNIRQRVIRIAQYKPYRQTVVNVTLIIAMLCIMATVIWIQGISYDRYNENGVMFAYGYDGKNVTFFDTNNVLQQMISYDENYAYVDREAFENYLQKNNAVGDIFIVFGGFYKLPGVGEIGCSFYYEFGSKEQVVKIPYENPMSDWRVKLLKML
ncbi:MAG: M56 family metallopeptidase [Lachnospiraceae bacterium]|nr:M56 family metallopeptidase [Lachnospiraceae bacterium]